MRTGTPESVLPSSIESCVTAAVQAMEAGAIDRVREHACWILSNIRQNPDQQVAFWHPLGCLYIELRRDARQSVRIHVWGLPDGRFSGSGLSIHCHDFDLRSAVLAGTLVNQEYVPCNGSPSHLVYEIQYEGDINQLQTNPQNPMNSYKQQDSCHLLPAGTLYEIPAGQFHATGSTCSGPAVTLVIADLQTVGESLVLGPMSGPSVHLTRRNRCSARELDSALDLTLRLLTSARNG
jgi:hypothetical protein